MTVDLAGATRPGTLSFGMLRVVVMSELSSQLSNSIADNLP